MVSHLTCLDRELTTCRASSQESQSSGYCYSRVEGLNVIYLSRLDGTRFVLNANRIETIEARPDTVITVVDGKHFVVKESVDDVIARAIAYQRALLSDRFIPAWLSGEEATSG